MVDGDGGGGGDGGDVGAWPGRVMEGRKESYCTPYYGDDGGGGDGDGGGGGGCAGGVWQMRRREMRRRRTKTTGRTGRRPGRWWCWRLLRVRVWQRPHDWC